MFYYNVYSIDSKLDMIIGDNTYSDEGRLPGVGKLSSNYYYSDYMEDLYTGDEFKLVLVFKVPTSEFDKKVSFEFKDWELDFDGICVSSETIKHMNSDAEIAKAADPEGYANESQKREKADSKTASAVSNGINGLYWTFFVNNTSYKIEFYSSNKYELTVPGHTTTGKYFVLRNYIKVINDSTDAENFIPWEKTSKGYELDPAAGFDVSE